MVMCENETVEPDRESIDPALRRHRRNRLQTDLWGQRSEWVSRRPPNVLKVDGGTEAALLENQTPICVDDGHRVDFSEIRIQRSLVTTLQKAMRLSKVPSSSKKEYIVLLQINH